MILGAFALLHPPPSCVSPLFVLRRLASRGVDGTRKCVLFFLSLASATHSPPRSPPRFSFFLFFCFSLLPSSTLRRKKKRKKKRHTKNTFHPSVRMIKDQRSCDILNSQEAPDISTIPSCPHRRSALGKSDERRGGGRTQHARSIV